MKTNTKNINRLIVIGIISFLLLTPLSMARVRFTSNTGSQIEEDFTVSYTMDFLTDDLSFSKLLGYDIVKLKDHDYLNIFGEPMLPKVSIRLALPSGMTAEKINIIESHKVLLDGEYTIFPSQPPLSIGQELNDVDFIEPKNVIYQSNEYYPSFSVEIVEQADLAGQSFAEIALYPIQYNPFEKKLVLTTFISFEVEGSSGYICGDYLSDSISEKGLNIYEQMVKSLVVNPNVVCVSSAPQSSMQSLALPPGGPFDHVIITSSSNEAYYAPLVEWRTKSGLKSTIITTEYIYANYVGSDDQEEIRDFIIDAYSQWGTYYFLLAGEHSTVPFKYKTFQIDDDPPEYEDVPSDMYYGSVDADRFYEVFVGRSTAEGSTQIDRFIDKILKYETDPPLTNYPLEITLLGMDLTTVEDDGILTRGEDLKINIDNWYIPSRFAVTEVYDTDSSNHETDFKNALNAGQNLVNHNDHSYYNVMGCGDKNHPYWYITSSDVDGFSNDDQMSIIISTGCHALEMDYNDCIGEHFVIYNSLQAGVAFIGNTRNGVFYAGDSDSLTMQLDRYWWKGLFDEDKNILSEALVYAKNENPYSGSWVYSQWSLNLLGEPAMPIWTNTPDSFVVTHDTSVSTGTQFFTVHVENSSGDLTNAYVCAWKDGEIFETGFTNSNGDITIQLTPITIGEVYITVTKQDHLPYQGSAIVIAEGAPYAPSNPNPEDNAIAVLTESELSWTGGDPEGDPVTYDVYFGTTNSPPSVSIEQSDTNYDPPGDLQYNTEYFWKIVAHDDNGHTTEGPEWTFTSINESYMIIEDAAAQPGADGVVVNIIGQYAQALGGYQIFVKFDETKLEFWKVDFTDTIAVAAAYSEGQLTPEYTDLITCGAVWIFDNPSPGQGLLAKLVFNVSGGVPLDEEIPFTFEVYHDDPSLYTADNGFNFFPDLVDGTLTTAGLVCGDANGDSAVNVGDAVFLINYIFKGGPAPVPDCVGDANGDGSTNVGDAVYIINYVFKGGPPPVKPNGCNCTPP